MYCPITFAAAEICVTWACGDLEGSIWWRTTGLCSSPWLLASLIRATHGLPGSLLINQMDKKVSVKNDNIGMPNKVSRSIH
jgi:hypothetical protein